MYSWTYKVTVTELIQVWKTGIGLITTISKLKKKGKKEKKNSLLFLINTKGLCASGIIYLCLITEVKVSYLKGLYFN